MIVAPSTRPGIDVEYLFAQVSVGRDLVDITPNSGNMLSGVAPFAIERGLVAAARPGHRVRILDLNTGKVFEARGAHAGGRVTYQGDYELDGVPGTARTDPAALSRSRRRQDGAAAADRQRVDVVDGIGRVLRRLRQSRS